MAKWLAFSPAVPATGAAGREFEPRRSCGGEIGHLPLSLSASLSLPPYQGGHCFVLIHTYTNGRGHRTGRVTTSLLPPIGYQREALTDRGNALAAGRRVFLIPLAIYEPYSLTSPTEKI